MKMLNRLVRRRTAMLLLLLTVAAGAGGCAAASAPVVPPTPAVTFQDKMTWILRLEDQRVLRDPPGVSSATPAATPAPVPAEPDLLRLLQDPEPRIRRRAALAVGRVGLREGIDALIVALNDPEPEVRQMAAFSLGLIGDTSATGALLAALGDPSPLVQGRAAQALGLIGATGAADAIGAMARTHVAAVFDVAPDELSHPMAPAVEAFRLGLYALAELKAYAPLAAAVLDPEGQPRLWWWPVAYALQRLEDPRALAALRTLAGVEARQTALFATQGLGALGDVSAVPVLERLLGRDERALALAAFRALGQIRDERAAAAILRRLRQGRLDSPMALEAVTALGRLGADGLTEVLLELVTHPWPPLRGAALETLAKIDRENFVLVLSGLAPDPDWRVRAALARAFAFVDPDLAVHRLTGMLDDADRRVVPAVLESLAHHRAAGLVPTLRRALQDPDVVVRKHAARLLGSLRAPEAAPALAAAYRDWQADPTYLARAAALEALAQYPDQTATATLTAALTDPDWAVRLVAARLLTSRHPESDYDAAIRPAPTRRADAAYGSAELIAPTVSPHAYIETAKGTIEIELAVLEAPLTVENFTTLARRGFFDGLLFHRVAPNFVVQTGDPRADSEGGPGYTIRDELNELPYLRGTVGMALDWADTGGSQFFLTHGPQPRLDARYTAFGRVVAGMEVIDAIEQGEVIRRVLIWDGSTPIERPPLVETR